MSYNDPYHNLPDLFDYLAQLPIYLLERCRWYRRWRGGLWQKWLIRPPVCASFWFQIRDGEDTPWGALMLDAEEDYRALPVLPCAGPYRSAPRTDTPKSEP